jgi:hypothetical protein
MRIFYIIIILALISTMTNAQNLEWAKNVGGTCTDEAYKIAYDSIGNCYIIGVFESTADFDPGVDTANLTSVYVYDIFIAKYDKNGNYLWAKDIGMTYLNFDNYGIAIDKTGNCYVTGSFEGASDFDPGPGTAILTSVGVDDIFFAKYDANGNYLWARSIGSTNIDYGYSIALDSIGNCYIAG